MPRNDVFTQLIENIELVMLGKREAVEIVVATMLARGHILLEDVPGVGKTILARSVACSVDANFSRIQCTPDLLPSDITGVSLYDPSKMEFEFRPGPVFSQVLLADEINRATPRAQSALLEAMEERQVSIGGTTHSLPDLFFMIATQNPIEMSGTFPLPEAQLDRFMARITLGYPDDNIETQVMMAQRSAHPLTTLRSVVTVEQLLAAQEEVTRVFVHPSVVGYIQQLVSKTRTHEHAAYGSSPRGSLALMRASQAMAKIMGEEFVNPDCIKRLASAVLAHRIVIKPRSRVQGVTGQRVVEDIIGTVEVPVDLERP